MSQPTLRATFLDDPPPSEMAVHFSPFNRSTCQPLNRSTTQRPNTDRIMRDTFWIGLYPGFTEDMFAYMAETIRGFLKK